MEDVQTSNPLPAKGQKTTEGAREEMHLSHSLASIYAL